MGLIEPHEPLPGFGPVYGRLNIHIHVHVHVTMRLGSNSMHCISTGTSYMLLNPIPLEYRFDQYCQNISRRFFVVVFFFFLQKNLQQAVHQPIWFSCHWSLKKSWNGTEPLENME